MENSINNTINLISPKTKEEEEEHAMNSKSDKKRYYESP